MASLQPTDVPLCMLQPQLQTNFSCFTIGRIVIKIVVSSKSLLANNQNNKSNIKTITTLHCITLHASTTALLYTPLHSTTLLTTLHYTISYYTSLHLQCNSIRQYNAMQFKKQTTQYSSLQNTAQHDTILTPEYCRLY